MGPERWRQVEQLYHQALEQEAGSRAAFLIEACRGDEDLRREVESLLAAADYDDTFLEAPAVQVEAKARIVEESRFDLAGRTVSHYRVIQRIGAGGMGVVYLALDETLDRQVALKVLPPSTLADESARKRLRKEALALAKFSHPNIETVYEFGSQDGIDFLVTEYVAGTTLADRIASGPLPESQLLDITAQIGSALEEAASHQLVHLDLKPSNIMLTPKGQIKLLDFGLAKIVKSHERRGTDSLTTINVAMGTPPYMAPEQLLGGRLDVRTDIYAVGASLYELATGRVPFRAKTSPELIASILQTTVEPPSSTGANLSPGLERLILKCLEKDPERRYQTVGELMADLALPPAPASKLALLPPPLARILRPKAWLLSWKAGVLFFGLVAAILTVWLLRSRPVLSFAPREWVLVTDFDNQTNDPIFDQSLLTAFTVSLEQSRRANMYPRSRVREALARMKKDGTTRIDESVGREIAVREGIRALILPSISGVGEDYRLAARIRDATTGLDVKTTIVKARGKDRVLDGVDRLAAKVRRDLGESLLATSRDSRPLARVTTANLDALKQYSIGLEKLSEADYRDAKTYYENALKIDPSFNAARTSLGILDFERFDPKEGKRLLSEAVRSADNLTNREKYGLLAFHARAVEGNAEKAVGYLKILTGLYPDFAEGHNNLAIAYREMGRYQDAVAEFKECLKINPRLRITVQGLIYTYISLMGDLDHGIEACRMDIAKSGPSAFAYSWMGYAYLAKGRRDEAVSDLRQAVDLNARLLPAIYDLAVAYLLSGQGESAVKVLDGLVAFNPRSCDAYYYLGLAYNSLHQNSDARRQWLQSVDCLQEVLKSPANEAADYLQIAIARTRLGDAAGAQAAEEKARAMDPALYFDTARLRAVQGKTEEAVALLERAEKNGLHNFAWVKLNPDLQGLAGEPRMQAMLQRNLKGLDSASLEPSH